MLKKNNNKGFTLVELLVVIAIIGILAVVAVPALFKNIEKGKVADLEADMSAIRSAVLSYYAENSEYPMDDNNGTESGGDLTPIILKPDNTSLDAIKNAGSKAILSELEGLSFPFGGQYELTNANGGVAANNVVKSPDTLYLKITTKDASTTISQAGLEKLAKDLGLTLVEGTLDDGVETLAATAATSTTIFVDKTADEVQKIVIPLVNK